RSFRRRTAGRGDEQGGQMLRAERETFSEPSRRVRWLGAAALVATVLLASGNAAALQPANGDVLPDVQMLPASALEVRTPAAGVRQLWFAAEIVNTQTGPLELMPRAEDCNHNGDFTDDRTAYQRIYSD